MAAASRHAASFFASFGVTALPGTCSAVALTIPQIQSLDGEVVVISFGTEDWIRVWLKETQSPFPMLLDQERQAYQAYGLERSLLRSWGLKTIWRYVQLLLSGRKWRGIKGDPGQLGGDFIVDSEGIIRLAYPSRDPTDRPAVAHLLAVVESLSG